MSFPRSAVTGHAIREYHDFDNIHTRSQIPTLNIFPSHLHRLCLFRASFDRMPFLETFGVKIRSWPACGFVVELVECFSRDRQRLKANMGPSCCHCRRITMCIDVVCVWRNLRILSTVFISHAFSVRDVDQAVSATLQSNVRLRLWVECASKSSVIQKSTSIYITGCH